jgi:hypothetical protein
MAPEGAEVDHTDESPAGRVTNAGLSDAWWAS